MPGDQLTLSVKGISAELRAGAGHAWAEHVGKNAGAAPEPDPAPGRAGTLLRTCVGCAIAPRALPAGKFDSKPLNSHTRMLCFLLPLWKHGS